MSVIDLAREIATAAHAGQTRKFGPPGVPYIEHPAAVAQLLSLWDPTDHNLIAAGWLHDVLEDTEISAGELLALGVPQDTVYLVLSVTKRPGETYRDFIARVADSGYRAAGLKRCDIAHNRETLPAGHGLHERYKWAADYLAEEMHRSSSGSE